jgi:hypothetical protein
LSRPAAALARAFSGRFHQSPIADGDLADQLFRRLLIAGQTKCCAASHASTGALSHGRLFIDMILVAR